MSVYILSRVTATKITNVPAWYNDINLAGKVVLITGATETVGQETAWRLLAYEPKCLIIGVRNAGKEDPAEFLIKAASRACGKKLDPGIVKVIDLDLSDMSSVVKFTDIVRKEQSVIDLMVFAADSVDGVDSKTVDGFNRLSAVNALSHFLMYERLKELLLKERPKVKAKTCAHCSGLRRLERPAVVTLTSCAHMLAPSGKFDARRMCYAGSKLACLYLAQHIAANEKGIDAYSVHPGFVATSLSALTAGAFGLSTLAANLAARLIGKSPANAAQAIIACALGGKAQSGQLYQHGRLTRPSDAGASKEERERAYAEMRSSLKPWLL